MRCRQVPKTVKRGTTYDTSRITEPPNKRQAVRRRGEEEEEEELHKPGRTCRPEDPRRPSSRRSGTAAAWTPRALAPAFSPRRRSKPAPALHCVRVRFVVRVPCFICPVMIDCHYTRCQGRGRDSGEKTRKSKDHVVFVQSSSTRHTRHDSLPWLSQTPDCTDLPTE